MKSIYHFLYSGALLLAIKANLYGQCSTQVTLASGTQTIAGCVEVTVTHQGAVSILPYVCPASGVPFNYWIGQGATSGSYTFNFSPPISALTLNFGFIEQTVSATEEVSIELNGSFYPVTTPGTPNGCNNLAIVTPSGTIGGCTSCPFGSSGWAGTNISGLISSLEVTDTVLAGVPSGSLFSLFICTDNIPCCQLNAGTLPPLSDNNFCVSIPAQLPPPVQSSVGSGELLGYALFTNPGNMLGSIIATSNTPQFSFDPATMQTGVSYYVAVIAGQELNGWVNLNGPCIDISNVLEIIWQPPPAVTLTVPNNNLCPGACIDISAQFTGAPPFTLTYQAGSGGLFTETFSNHNGVFQVCAPLGTSAGPFQVHTASVSDAYCVCQ